MTSCSSSSDDEAFKKQEQNELGQSTITPLAGLTTEEGLHYLNKKYTERFTAEDALFTEALTRPTIPPPIVLNFNGKQPIQGRRSGGYNNNNRRYDNDGGRRNDHDGGRRFDRGGRGGGGDHDGQRYDRNDRG